MAHRIIYEIKLPIQTGININKNKSSGCFDQNISKNKSRSNFNKIISKNKSESYFDQVIYRLTFCS